MDNKDTHSSYYVGDFREDGLHGSNRGWLVGTFMDAAPRKNDDVEIKYFEFAAGETAKTYLKESAIIEVTFILRGRTKCLIGDETIELKAGEYIVIKPGTPNNTVAEILEDVQGLCVKSPSDPSAKKILP